MSVDEYAALELAAGAKVVRTTSGWWREVRPFFYRPLLVFRELKPQHQHYPLRSCVGGVQHIVPDGTAANSSVRLLLFENPQSYALKSLTEDNRYHIRRAMKTFAVKPMVTKDEFIEKGYPVYLSFFERTQYRYKEERTDKHYFAAWADTLFLFPKLCILGAFRGEELASVSVSYVVEDVLFTATFFSKSNALREYVSDLMLHVIREGAAEREDVSFIFVSTAGMGRGLDEFYLRRGATLVTKPAFLKANPLLLTFVKTFKKDQYVKLGAQP